MHLEQLKKRSANEVYYPDICLTLTGTDFPYMGDIRGWFFIVY